MKLTGKSVNGHEASNTEALTPEAMMAGGYVSPNFIFGKEFMRHQHSGAVQLSISFSKANVQS